MKLTGELRNQADRPDSMGQKKSLAGKAGIGLTENELEMVSGGAIQGSSEYDDNGFKDDNGDIYEDMVGEIWPTEDLWTEPFD